MEIPNSPQSSSEMNVEPKRDKAKFIFCCDINLVTCSQCCCSLNSAVRTVSILDIVLFFILIIALVSIGGARVFRVLRIGGSFSLIVVVIPATVQLIYACCIDMKRKDPIYLGKVGMVYYYCKLLQILIMIILAIIMSAIERKDLFVGIILAIASLILQIYFAYLIFSYFNLLLQKRVDLVLHGNEKDNDMSKL